MPKLEELIAEIDALQRHITNTSGMWSAATYQRPLPIPCSCGELALAYCCHCHACLCFGCFMVHYTDGHHKIADGASDTQEATV